MIDMQIPHIYTTHLANKQSTTPLIQRHHNFIADSVDDDQFEMDL